MNHHQKHLSACLIALAALFSTAPMAWAATAPSLGSAASFAVLGVGTAIPPSTKADASTAVSTTGSTITGDVGSAGAVTLTGSTIKGNVLLNGAYTQTPAAPPPAYSGTLSTLPIQVIKDFNTAYNQYANITCTGTLDTTYTDTAFSLPPGVYCNTGAVTFTRTTLTLDGPANGVWIFKIGTAGTGALTSTGLSVVMAGGGLPCNVTWWVAEAATGTTSGFQGTILAGAAITMTGSITPTTSFNGDALAKAAVTLTNFAITSCGATSVGKVGKGSGKSQSECNQGVGNGSENCDPGHSDKNQSAAFPWGPKSNDENGGTPGNPGRKGGNK